MSPLARFDVVLLTILLVYVFAVFVDVCRRYSLARRQTTIHYARRKALVASLNIEIGSLKSIALIAPYLGLLGTCIGLLNMFGGIAMEKHAAFLMFATRVSVAPIATVVAIPVAALATCFHNYVLTRMDLLEDALREEGSQRDQYIRRASRLPLANRFSELPSFGLMGAPALTLVIAGFMTFTSFNTPTGHSIELGSIQCEHDDTDRLIVLHITASGKLLLNQEPQQWDTLRDRLGEIYNMREYRTLYLLADSDVSFQTVADVIDTVRNVPATSGDMDIKVRLVTPGMRNDGCIVLPVASSRNHALS